MSRNPLLFVRSNPTDYARPNRPAGGGKKFFAENYSEEHRENLRSAVENILDSYQLGFSRFGNVPGVIKVTLFDDALAKSHRPHEIFYKSECDLVGGANIGEIYFSVDPTSMELLESEISATRTKVGLANLSTIKKIESVGFSQKSSFESIENLFNEISENDGFLKLRLFNFRNQTDNENALRALLALYDELNVNIRQTIRYSSNLSVHKIAISSLGQLSNISDFLASKSLETFGKVNLIHPSVAIPLRPYEADEIPQPENGVQYPIVGVFDSGIDPTNHYLAPWIVGSETYIASNDSTHNYNHGSFIGGLIVNARSLNHEDSRLPSCRSKIFDVAGLHAAGMSEEDLRDRLEDAIQRNPHVKVWNLSLNIKTPCVDHAFSDIGVFLDDLQARYGVSIVVSAGNYEIIPLRAWPADVGTGVDRIAPPADSIRAITVGALAHRHVANSKVKTEEPSPFSRRGPGPAFIAKPDVVHYGGNCTAQGRHFQTGLISVVGDQVAEDIGTSFSAPIVSNLLANIRHELGAQDSRLLAHGLLIHSALLKSKGLTAENMKYYGFGVPGDLPEVFDCLNHQATSVFEINLLQGFQFTKPFPIPQCLRTADGKVKGEFNVTLIYDPPVDPEFGSEYCRTNIDVSLGKVEQDEHGVNRHKLLIPLAPGDIQELYERRQIEHGYKWCPVKAYWRAIPSGIDANDWQLRVTLNNRKDFEPREAIRGIVIITISDPEANKPVYDDFKRSAIAMGLEVENLQLEERERVR